MQDIKRELFYLLLIYYSLLLTIRFTMGIVLYSLTQALLLDQTENTNISALKQIKIGLEKRLAEI